jgi:hypothetical protein
VQHGWFLVQQLPDAVTRPFAHNRKAIGFDIGLDCRANIPQVRATTRCANAAPHCLFGDLKQPLCFRGNRSDRQGDACIAVPPIEPHPDIDANDVSFLQSLVARNAMADDIVHGNADRSGKAAIPFVRRDRAVFPYKLFRYPVEFSGCDTRAHVLTQCIERRCHQSSCSAHQRDLLP